MDLNIRKIKNEIVAAMPQLYEIEVDFSLELIKYSENITFLLKEKVKSNNNIHKYKKRILRINRPQYHDDEELLGEIQWMQEIVHDTDLILPEVYVGLDGGFIQRFFVEHDMEYTCILFGFLEGQIIGELKGDELHSQIYNMGRILATLHLQVQNRNYEKRIARFSWGVEELLGTHARWGNWKDFKELSALQVEVLKEVEGVIKSRLKKFGQTSDKFGLIHADLHRSNIIVKEGLPQIFDFDDCGYGWYLYDFGCSLVEYIYVDDLQESLLNGYESLRKLIPVEKEEIFTFLLLRRLVRMAWVGQHSDSDTAKGIQKEYWTETIRMSKEYLKKFNY